MTTQRGAIHPITQYLRRAVQIFQELGFDVLESPEVVTEKHNFDDMRMPKYHPARGMQDTFWLDDGRLPRTHTSAFQVPAMKDRRPPVRVLVPGRVFRNEATDATHETTFHQVEGFVIDTDVSLANLKWTLTTFVKSFFGSDVALKFVPSYFPFVEPGVEAYIKVGDRWLEILGAGMIHPDVLKKMGVDPEQYQGYAFGFGLDRLLLMDGIEDVRHLYAGNLRFLNQFREAQ